MSQSRTLVAPLLAAGLIAAATATVASHVGTSNAYFDGAAGPYGVRVIVRTPGVIPGLAQASVRILSGESVDRVSVRPLRSDLGLDGAPPPDIADPVPGETGLYSAELWLMTAGSYSIEVTVAGAGGEGTVFVPVLAVAERLLPMNPAIGFGLAAAGLFLFVGAVTIIGAAVRESVLEPGLVPDARRRWHGRIAMALFTLPLVGVLGGGWIWWDAIDAAYRNRIYRPWSTTTDVEATEGRLLLTLTIDDPAWSARESEPGAGLLPDHGKLMHMFVVRADDLSAFAHVHPVRVSSDTFRVALPPLPDGEYRIYADIVHESGFAPTLVDSVTLPPSPATPPGTTVGGAVPSDVPAPDPDDSWAKLLPHGESEASRYALSSGRVVHWEREPTPSADEETTLRFSVTETDGTPSPLEPYMGMLSHAAVVRDDGSLFVHLHPSGSINLTAQQRFVEAENARGGEDLPAGRGHAGAMDRTSPTAGSVTFPFVFPEPGSYRIVAPVKMGAAVVRAPFDLVVEES